MKKILYLLLFIPFLGNTQTITTVAGIGTMGYSGDNGPAISAQLYSPDGIAVDTNGNIFIADTYNQVIRKVNAAGIITTIAGNGTGGYSGDGNPASSAGLFLPSGLALDKYGNLFIADYANNRIRKINTSGIITTVAGTGTAGYTGNSGPATAAELNGPGSIVIDTSGNLYIAETGNNVIRKINTSGSISLIAGNGATGYGGDGSAATAAQLNIPTEISLDDTGNIYVSDKVNNRIRKINTSGIITTFAGNGTSGFMGDGSIATSAEFRGPSGVLIIADSCYIADQSNQRIRKVVASGNINTIAGDGNSGYLGDGGPATAAELHNPFCLASDAHGNVYFSDGVNHCIRKLSYQTTLVKEVIKQSSIAIYPNPATTELTISSTDKITNITITNLLGQTFYNHIYNTEKIQVDVANLPKGMYLIKVNGSEVRKFVKL